MPWKSAIALPNCLRSLAYPVAWSSAPWAMPIACAAMVTRVWSRVRSAVLKPLPSAPISRSAGMRQCVEVELARRRALDAELLLRGAEGEPLVPLLHDERRDAVGAGVGVGHGHHGVELRHSGVGDPPLRAVEDVGVAVAHRPGPHRHGVAAGFGLGQRVGEHRVAAGHRWQVALAQVLRRGEQQRHRAELVDRGDQRCGRADPRHLLDHQAGRQRVGSRAAVLLRHVHGMEVGPAERVVRRLRELPACVHFRGERRDLVLAHGPHGRPEHVVLVGELEQVEHPVGHVCDSPLRRCTQRKAGPAPMLLGGRAHSPSTASLTRPWAPRARRCSRTRHS